MPTNMITPPKTPNHGTSSQHPQQVAHPHHDQDYDLSHYCTNSKHLPGSTRRCQRQERGCLQLPRGIRGLLLQTKVSPHISCCVEKLIFLKDRFNSYRCGTDRTALCTGGSTGCGPFRGSRWWSPPGSPWTTKLISFSILPQSAIHMLPLFHFRITFTVTVP